MLTDYDAKRKRERERVERRDIRMKMSIAVKQSGDGAMKDYPYTQRNNGRPLASDVMPQPQRQRGQMRLLTPEGTGTGGLVWVTPKLS